MAKEIKEIITGLGCYKVGVNGVTKIIDNSIEFENAINFIYNIYVEKKLIAELVNVRVIIVYK